MYIAEPNAPRFRFELTSPEKVEYSNMEQAVLLPGEDGDMTVLAMHTPLLTALRPGIVALSRPNGTAPEEFFIAGGFADISNEHCIILTPQVVRLEDLSRDDIEEKIARLEVDLQDAGADDQKAKRLQQQLMLLHMQLDVANS